MVDLDTASTPAPALTCCTEHNPGVYCVTPACSQHAMLTKYEIRLLLLWVHLSRVTINDVSQSVNQSCRLTWKLA